MLATVRTPYTVTGGYVAVPYSATRGRPTVQYRFPVLYSFPVPYRDRYCILSVSHTVVLPTVQ